MTTKGSYSDTIASLYQPQSVVATVNNVLSYLQIKKDGAQHYADMNNSLISKLPVLAIFYTLRKTLQKGNVADVIHPAARRLIAPLIIAGLAYDFMTTGATCYLGGMDNTTTTAIVSSHVVKQSVANFAVPLAAYKLTLKATKNPFVSTGVAVASAFATSYLISDACDSMFIKARLRLAFTANNAYGAERFPLGDILFTKSHPASAEYISAFPNLMLAEASPETEVPADVAGMAMMSRYQTNHMVTPKIDEVTGDLYDHISDTLGHITGVPVDTPNRLMKNDQTEDLEEYAIAIPEVVAMDSMMGFTLPKDLSAESKQKMLANVEAIMKSLGQ